MSKESTTSYKPRQITKKKFKDGPRQKPLMKNQKEKNKEKKNTL